MTMELMQSNSRYLNAKLQKVTDQIRTYDMNVRNNQYAIAYMIGRVDVEGIYKDDGFDTCASWACDAFGIAKTLAYNLIAIGKEYTRPVLNSKGKVMAFASNIVEADEHELPTVDFTVDQIARMRPLGRDKVVELYKAGQLAPHMTTADMVKVVKANKAKRINAPEAPEAVQNAPEAPEAVQNAPEAPEAPEAVQNAPEAPEAPEIVDVPRSPDFDNISTRFLIAELYYRGFKVFNNSMSREVVIHWHEQGYEGKGD